MKNLRIATFNINGIRARLPNLLEWLEREKTDIACLQELKAVDKDFPAAELESVGYGAIWHGQASWTDSLRHLDPPGFTQAAVTGRGIPVDCCLGEGNALYLAPNNSALVVSAAPTPEKDPPHESSPTERYGSLSAAPGFRCPSSTDPRHVASTARAPYCRIPL